MEVGKGEELHKTKNRHKQQCMNCEVATVTKKMEQVKNIVIFSLENKYNYK